MAGASQTVGAGVTGLAGIRAVLQQLPQEVQDRILSTALEDACAPIEEAARRYAPVRTGALRASISHKIIHRPGRPFATALIGPSRDSFSGGVKLKKGASRQGADRPANYAHLVEFGHATPKGRVSPHPFMRPAVAEGIGAVGDNLATGISDGIYQAARRLAVAQ